jgi:hypothetical protein
MRRDRHSIIIQHNYQQPDDETQWDGGDSISRTGIMAMCGSERDQLNMVSQFWKSNGEIVRHPYQPVWNEYKEMSRDQLVCAVAGMYSKQAETVRKRHWLMINKDLLAPDVKLHLALCANHWSKYLWGILGFPWLILSILWSCYVTPNHELNQILCQCVKAGKPFLWLLCKLHPNWKKNVMEYWGVEKHMHGFWRDQEEIADTMIAFVMRKLK